MTTAKQKRWVNAVASTGCIVTGESQIQIHHIWGRKAKHNKVAIGEWAVLPLAIRLHDVHSNHHLNVTHWKNRFEIEYGRQQDLWVKLHNKVVDGIRTGAIDLSYDDLPPMSVVYEIQNYRK